MKKINLKSILLLSMVSATIVSNAQLAPPTFPDPNPTATAPTHNFYRDYVGVQLAVTEPAAIASSLVYTIANEGNGGTNEWGGAITAPIYDKELVFAEPDSLACQPITNSMTGKIALIYRGDCEFGFKALAAQNAGAEGIIIVNHTPGGPVGMGAGAVGSQVNSNFPVFMISKEDGDKIYQRLKNNETVKVSFKTWGFGHTSDLGILNNGLSTYHALAIPHYQLAGSGSPGAYKAYDGAFIANFGLAPSTNVKLKTELEFVPAGSTTGTVVRVDSFSFPIFQPNDSVLAVGMNSTYDLNPTQTGRYDVKYTLSSASPDQYLGDNSLVYSIHITNDVFSKGRYNPAKDEPVATRYTRYGGTTPGPNVFGNLYYNAVGGHRAISSKFSVFRGANTPTLENLEVKGILFQWRDTLFADTLVQLGELRMVGFGTKTFSPTDSQSKFYEISWLDPINSQPVVLDANSWYYVAVEIPADLSLGFDGITNFYPRSFFRHNMANSYNEFASAGVNGDQNQILNPVNADVTPQHFLFDTGILPGGTVTAQSFITSDTGARYAQQKEGFIPAISLRTSMWTNSISTTTKATANIDLYPNPAANVLHVAMNLDKMAANVSITVLEMTGKRLSVNNYSNVQKDNVSLSTSNLPNGVYLMYIDIDGKHYARQFSVNR